MEQPTMQEWLRNPGPIKTEGIVQHYAWGGYEYIPRLIGQANTMREPFAELWLGTHPKAPARVAFADGTRTLDDIIQSEAAVILGPSVRQRFGAKLPFLFKVLDARMMLSIQVHPQKRQAREGYQREDALGIPLHAHHRNYKDTNHKPELHVALTDFRMLHGFREPDDIADLLSNIPEFAALHADFAQALAAAGSDAERRKEALQTLYRTIMEMPQSEVDALLEPLVHRLSPLYRLGGLDKNSPDYWAARAAEQFPMEGGHMDRGIFSVYLLNLLHLQPGEATFQAAGVPHAYLEGSNVEIMASSDNVLRGGLTPKYIDVPELLKTLSYEHGATEVITGTQASDCERVYNAPSEEFILSMLHIEAEKPCQLARNAGPDIVMVLSGILDVKWGNSQMQFTQGEAFFVPAGVGYTLYTPNKAHACRASVPFPI